MLRCGGVDVREARVSKAWGAIVGVKRPVRHRLLMLVEYEIDTRDPGYVVCYMIFE